MSIPFVFDAQQRFCNDYSSVGAEFTDYLGQRNQQILDVGCSTGVSAAHMIDMEANDYTGVDINPGYVAVAGKRYPQGRFLNVNACEMPFGDNIFDRVLLVGVLHHMDDATARSSLSEVRRVLKQDGKVLVAEPIFTPTNRLSTLLLRLDRGAHIRDQSGYTGLLQDFCVERTRFFNLSLHRFCSFVLGTDRRVIRTDDEPE